MQSAHNTDPIHERVEKTKIFRLDVEVFESVDELLRLLPFRDNPFRAFLESKNRSITWRIVECFLSNGLGNIVRLLHRCARLSELGENAYDLQPKPFD